MQQEADTLESLANQSSDVPLTRPVRIVMMLALALVLTWICGYWIRQAEIIILICQITEAVPSIPGVAVLLFLVAVNPLIRRLPLVRELSRGEIVVVYLLVTVATTMFGCGIVRFLIATISAPFYFTQMPGTPLDKLAPNIPAWLSPPDTVTHLWMHETSPTGLVPWGAWWLPIASWTGFFLLLGGTLLCLMILLSETWIDHERLVFPLVRLPIEILGKSSTASFFRNPWTWAGIGAAALLNGVSIIRTLYFGAPGGALYLDLGKQFADYPWRALRPLVAILKPNLIGLGYLVSTEILFSVWFFFLFHKLQAFGFAMAGYRVQEIPYIREQGIGAFVILGLVLLWKSRSAIRQAWRELLAGRDERQQDRPPYGWALLGAMVGIFGVIAFWVSAGMALWLASLYLAIILLVGIVYARIRAETGVPLIWAFPISQPHLVILNFLGQAPVTGSKADLASPTIFAMMRILSRGYFPMVSGYEIEGLRMGQQTGVTWRQMSTTLLLGIAVGVVAAFVFHLQPFYMKGTGGPWGAGSARQAFGSILHGAETPTPPDLPRIAATSFGSLLIALLVAARSAWFGFPLHPIGYAVTCSYGDLLWGPFLVVWVIKGAILRYGGSQLYLKALPAFLGFALGHFATAGMIWVLLASTFQGRFLEWAVCFG